MAQRFGGATGLGPGVLGPDWALPLLSRFLESTWSKARARSPLLRSSTVTYLLAGKYCSSRYSHGIVQLSCVPRVPAGSSHLMTGLRSCPPCPPPVNCTECGCLSALSWAADRMWRLAALLSRTRPLWSGQGCHKYSAGGTVVKSLPANAWGSSSIPGSGRSPGGGNGNPLQYSFFFFSTPVFLPGKSHGQRSRAGYSPWGCKELDTTEHTAHGPILVISLRTVFFTQFYPWLLYYNKWETEAQRIWVAYLRS